MRSHRTISRRQFIRTASTAALATPLLLGAQERPAPAAAVASGKSRVVLVRDFGVLDENGQPRAAVVQDMLDTGVKALTGKPDPQSAWKTIIRPTDIVGIKNNRWPYLRTTPEVEERLLVAAPGAADVVEELSEDVALAEVTIPLPISAYGGG